MQTDEQQEVARLRAEVAELRAQMAREFAARLADNAVIAERIKSMETCLSVPEQLADSVTVALQGMRQLRVQLDAERQEREHAVGSLFKITGLQGETIETLAGNLNELVGGCQKAQAKIIRQLGRLTRLFGKHRPEAEADPSDPYRTKHLGEPMG